jgi:hypothetical protein
MYTTNPLFIESFSILNRKYQIKNSEIRLVFFYLDNDFCKGLITQEYINLLRNINKVITKEDNVHLFMDSDLAIELYQPYFTDELKILPFPLYKKSDFNNIKEPKKLNSKHRIGFFGYATKKHGFEHVFNLVKRLDSTKYEFLIKANNQATFDKRIAWQFEAIEGADNVITCEDYTDKYYERINSCDSIIIPYSPEDYPVQTSGIFLDAVCHNKQIFVTKDTWMERRLEEIGGGVAFAELDYLIEVIEDKKRIQYNDRRKEFLNFFTVENFMKELSKDIKKTQFRKISYEKFQSQRAVMRKERTKSFNKKQFITYPQIKEEEVLADVLNRLSFALPNGDNTKVNVFVDPELKNVNIRDLSVPRGQHSFLNEILDFNLVESNIQRFLDEDSIVIHDWSVLEHSEIIKNSDKVYIIDPRFYSHTESTTLRSLFYNTLSSKEKRGFKEQSMKNFERMCKESREKNKAYCFATGPSFDTYGNYKFDKKAFKIICNSIIKNKDFLDYIGGADLLVFADPVFHFGVSKYAAQFRQDVLEYIKLNPSYLIIPEFTVPLMSKHYPELKKYLIGVPVKVVDNYNFPSKKHFFVKNTANILTLFMLPIASTIADNIYIFGADGREKKEKYFWKHSKTAQYKDKMSDAFNVHPSFFRDRDYEDYYGHHCELLEQLLQYGESNAREYISMTPSFIPSLKYRYIDNSIFSYGKIKTKLIKVYNKFKQRFR